ncbi:MAG: FlgD immunoglobulin-like domain containing protein, partial [Treponemataceae bacterium]
SAAENTLTIDGGVATTGTIVTKNIVFKNTNNSIITGTISTANFTHEGTEPLTIENAIISENWTSSGNLTATGTVSFIGNATSTITGSTNFNNFTCTVPSKTILFEAGSTQTITGSFTINGGSVSTRVTLKSIIPESPWFIDPQGKRKVEYTAVQDSTNKHTDNIITVNSQDLGDTIKWDFPRQEYEWTGNTNTVWDNKRNWNPRSVPGSGSVVKINDGLTNYPILNTDVDLGADGVIEINATIENTNKAHLDGNEKTITVGEILNKGKIRLKGTEIINPEAARVNDLKSLIEYYGDVADIDKAWGTSYANLLFAETVTGTFAGKLHVVETTTIQTDTNQLELNNPDNDFAGGVVINSGQTITLNGQPFSLHDGASGNPASCDSLIVDAAIQLDTDVSTTVTQQYNALITFSETRTLTSPLIEFVADVTGLSGANLVCKGDVEYSNNPTFTANAGLITFEQTLSPSAPSDSVAFSLMNEGSVEFLAEVSNVGEMSFSGNGGNTSHISFYSNLSLETFNNTIRNVNIYFNKGDDNQKTEITSSASGFDIFGILSFGNFYASESTRDETLFHSPVVFNPAEGEIHFAGLVESTEELVIKRNATIITSSTLKASTVTFTDIEITGSGTNFLIIDSPVFINDSVQIALADANITFNSTIDAGTAGKSSLKCITEDTTAKTIFNAVVGQTKALSSIEIDGNSEVNDVLIKTTDSQTYNGDISLTTDSVFESKNGSTLTPIAFTNSSSIEGSGFSLLLTANTVLDTDITFNCNVEFAGTVDSKTGSTANTLTVEETTTIHDNITTIGNQTYKGEAILAETPSSLLKFTTNNATVLFGTDFKGNRDVQIDSNVDFAGDVDLKTLVITKETNISKATIAELKTEGKQDYNGNITTDNNGITFTVTGAKDLDVSNITGDTGSKNKNAVYFDFDAIAITGDLTFDADLQLRKSFNFSTNNGDLVFNFKLDANRNNIVFNSAIGSGQISFNDIHRLGNGNDYCLTIQSGITNPVTFLEEVKGYNGFLLMENSSVVFNKNVKLTNGSAYNFLNGDVTVQENFEWRSSNSVTFNAKLDSTKQVSIVTSKADTVPQDTENIIMFSLGARVAVADLTINITNEKDGYFSVMEGAVITTTNFTQLGDGENQIAGTFIIGNGEFNTNVFINGETDITATQLTFKKNLFIDAFEKNVSFDNIQVTNNAAFFAGNISAKSNFTINEDIILLNGDPANMYNDTSAGQSGINNLFTYHHQGRTGKTAFPNLQEFPVEFPNKSAMSAIYTAALSFTTPVTMTVKGNFYNNGVNLSACTINIPTNESAREAFAEAYNASFANVQVKSDTAEEEAFISAAEQCTDDGGNTNIGFNRPLILINDPTKNTFESLSGTYTVFDDTIRLEFAYEGTSEIVAIENDNNEINAALANIKFDNGQKMFSEAFIDKECLIGTVDQGDIETGVIYLKTTTHERWNTDASGWSNGHEDSFDAGRKDGANNISFTHQTITPNLEIPKALAAVYQSLRDKYKNRIAHYIGAEIDQTGSPGQIFTAVADRCNPTVIAIKTGQEQHRRATESEIPSQVQKPYDAHNFIEIQYTEPMRFGDIPEGEINVKVQANFESASTHGGAITEVAGGEGIEVIGYFTSQYGRLKTGSRTQAIDTTVHSLYRSFSIDGKNENEKSYPTRIRIGIAAYASDPISINGKDTFNWEGFIDSSVIPSGLATITENQFLCDASSATPTGNAISAPLWDIIINNTPEADTVYGKWDSSAPTIAKYLKYENNIYEWDSASNINFHEVVPMEKGGSGTGYVDSIEFHFFDNTPLYDGSADEPYHPYKWVSRTGWLYNNDLIPAAEDRGGSRPFADKLSAKNRTKGGMRSSSLLDFDKAFSYKVSQTAPEQSFHSEFSQTINLPYFFQNQEDPQKDISPIDGLYLSLDLKPEDSDKFFLSNAFYISYAADKGYITDLAGNKLKTVIDAEIINRTPPAFNMSIASVSGKEVLIVFDRKMATKYNPMGGTEVDLLAQLPKELAIIDARKLPTIPSDPNDPNLPGIYWEDAIIDGLIDENIPAKNLKESGSISAFSITLTREISIEDILFYYIRVRKPEVKRPDPITGQDSFVPYIIDTSDNPMYYYREDLDDASKSEHVLSDFAINFVIPLYAYDSGVIDGEDVENTTGTLRIFDGSQNIANGIDFTLATRLQALGTEEITDFGKITLFMGVNPTPESISTNYNFATGSNQTVWLPEAFPPISSTPNTNDVKVLDADKLSESLYNFIVPNSTYRWPDESQVQFLFKYENPDTATYERMDLFRDYIYALRLDTLTDITSFDVWKFSLLKFIQQRGGVSVFNNVIDPTKNQETIIDIIPSRPGVVTVSIMTLDGNIIKYIHKGRLNNQMYHFKWDGRNNAGNPVARGLYFVRAVGPSMDETRKILVIKENF